MKKIIFTFCFLFSFLILKADTSYSFGPDTICSVWLDTLGNDCYQAMPDGAAPFTYLWNDGSTQNTACLTGPAGTDVCVTITDATGCVATSCYTIPPDCSVFIYLAGNPTSGHFLQAATTGAGNLTYQWSNGATSSSIFPNSSGTYCCTITDSNGCIADDCYAYQVNTTCSVVIDTTFQGGNCLEAIASGTAPFTYAWSNGMNQSVNCMVTPATEYCVTITDDTGCTATQCTWTSFACGVDVYINTITGSPLPLLEAAPWGEAPFTYSWSSGETTQSITPQVPGTYCVTITDNNACTSVNCIPVSLNSCTALLAPIQNGFCFEAISSGTAPFTYAWSDGSTGNTACSNTPGLDSICVDVTDVNGCVATACGVFGITNSCYVDIGSNSANTQLTANVSSVTTYTYQWSTGETTPSISPTTSGDYCVTITDGLNCTASDCFAFIANNSCAFNLEYIQNGFCLEAEPYIGVPPFTYLWSDGSTGSSVCHDPLNPDTLYCVTVTDATGCTSVDCGDLGSGTLSCDVQIDFDTSGGGITLITFSNGVAPFIYNWSTGENTESIPISSPGTYEVTITDAMGCVDSTMYYLSCQGEVYIEFDSTAVGNTTFTAHVWDNWYVPHTYLWSTGATTQSITGTTNEYYSVTVTDAIGCEIVTDTYNCWVQISATGDQLTASPNGIAPYTYLWNTGETSPAITAINSQSYTVTVTDSQGCTATDWYNYVSINTINGEIYLDSVTVSTGSNIMSARVYLIQHDAVAGTLTAIDSQDVSSTPNWIYSLPYSFVDKPDGDYLVKAALLPGSFNYENFLPTYHISELYWSDASTITLPINNTFTHYPIYMVVGNNPGGPGFIGGLVSEGANLTAGGQVETRGEGDPVPNVNVLLLTENDEPITHTLTNANGEFQFPDLAWGTYKVIVEMLGKDPGVQMVTIGPNSPSISIDFSVNETYITNIEDVLNGASIKVFPNPVEDKVNVQLELEENIELDINVINLLGNVIISENKNLDQGVNTLTINIKDLPSGIYFLNFSNGKGIISQRIIKN